MARPERLGDARAPVPGRGLTAIRGPGEVSSFPAVVVLAGLALSAFALGVAPTLMPDGYSWVAHTTSESAAQGLSGGWLARLAFLLFGLSVIWLTLRCARSWGRWAVLMHMAFGVFMMSAAAFSTRPWTTGTAFDPTEDALHSVAASAMGFAFAFGVVAQAMHKRGRRGRRGALDVIAVVAAVVVPLAMSVWPEFAGLLQRGMFVIAYLWYGVEAVGPLRMDVRA